MASMAAAPPGDRGCGRTVRRDVDSSRDRNEGSISPLATLPSRPRTLTSSGWMIVYVPWWRKHVRARTEAGSVDQIFAPLTVREPKVIGVAANAGSPGCSMPGSSYVPGALQLTGSPLYEVL